MNNIDTAIQISDINYVTLLLLLFGGALLGVIFFSGLYWTVYRAMQSAHPTRYFLSSFLLRSAILLSGLYLLTDGHWPRLLAAMTGFICARFAVLAISTTWTEKSSKKEYRDAP